jgi:hypothetical protein
MPRPRSTDLKGKEHDPVFYEQGVQRLLHKHFPYIKSKFVRERMEFKSPVGSDLAFARPLLFFRIACENAIQGGQGPRVREMFWEAFRPEPVLMANLLAQITEYRLKPPSRWNKERLISEFLASHPPLELGWEELKETIINAYAGEAPDVSLSNCSKIVNDINRHREKILNIWTESFKAFARVKETDLVELLPNSMKSGLRFLVSAPWRARFRRPLVRPGQLSFTAEVKRSEH